MNSIGLLLACIAFAIVGVESQCTDESVRVVWGPGPWEGNVQICYGGVWGWVCHNNFGTPDAKVVCTQLGYTSAGAYYRQWSYYGLANVSAPIHLDYMDCVGTETNLASCPHLYPVGYTTCGINQVAGVVCTSGGTCTNGNIRLVRNSNGTPLKSQGRVEVCHNSQWGTVCDDFWGTNDAKVACYQLGFSKDGATSYSRAAFGQGYGPIYLDNLGCSSAETSLFSCPSNGVGSHNCGHNEDAGARCNGEITTSCTNGDVMLWRAFNGAGPEYFGLALYCKNNAWTGVCDDSYTCHTARLFCQQLGYPGAILKRSRNFWGYYKTIDHYAWSCSSSHSSLSECNYYYHTSCNSLGFDLMGFACYPNIQGTSCTDGEVRLVNGTTSFNGRPEYCFEGEWAPMCSLQSRTASLMCKQLGFSSDYAITYNDERFGISMTRSNLGSVSCPNSATSLSQCQAVRKSWSGGCYLSISQCGTEYGLQCFNNTGSCVDGSIRLVNGTIQQEGRLEVCSQGIWGIVCQSSWNSIDAYIACKMLGYNGAGPTSLYGAYFGGGMGPPIYSNVLCHGWETSFTECYLGVYPSINCNPQTSAIGMICKEGCSNGDVRLLGGGFDNEGTIQVCYGNLWGLISDSMWDDNDAQVICNQLGFSGGSPVAKTGSFYGKPNNTIYLKDVGCVGDEMNIDLCTKTKLSITNGKMELATAEVAGVDCQYDTPTEPPYVQLPSSFNTPGTECTNEAVRVTGSGQNDRGRLEYCYNGYWSPFCTLDPNTASVACKQLNFNTYSWATIYDNGGFGTGRNFSLFSSIMCTGTETALSQCNMTTNPSATPWCRLANVGLRCFSGTECTTEGEVRLVDGIIDNEGRVEVCTNGIWGAICSQGWDTTDAHVICTQLGYPQLEPYIFANSDFGGGDYPIVYSNSQCGGFEQTYTSCTKQTFPYSNCSRSNIAGVLCGYDCNDGDVRLEGSQWPYEGTVEICFGNLWGLVVDSGWTQKDAEVLCQQLGYEPMGSIPVSGSRYGKPSLTLHYSSVDCVGTESTISECSYSSLSLQQGKDMWSGTDVAGVKCYTPDQCVTPPIGGADCVDGSLRLINGQPNIPEGTLQYCYKGLWSSFCYLGPNEATVACRQLGYTEYSTAVVFTDGRFSNANDSSSPQGISLFQNITCSDDMLQGTSMLTSCSMTDICQSTCDNPIGLRCYERANCMDGDVRLVDGNFDTEGRVEVCSNNIWGSICGTGFTAIDAYIVCRELGLGESEPTVYTNSFFGDGDTSILISELACQGFERTVLDCPRKDYGSFKCTRDNIVGIICQDQCNDGDIRLDDGPTANEGTVVICRGNTWGVIADADWGSNEAKVTCNQLGYTRGGDAVLGSYYSKPNKTILYNNFGCNGSETFLRYCPNVEIASEESRELYNHVNVAGVNCLENIPTKDPLASAISDEGSVAGLIIVVLLLMATIIAIIGMVMYIVIKMRQVQQTSILHEPRVQMSGLGSGYDNPVAGFDNDDGNEEFDTADRNALVQELSKD